MDEISVGVRPQSLLAGLADGRPRLDPGCEQRPESDALDVHVLRDRGGEFGFVYPFRSTGKVRGQWSDWYEYLIDNGAGIPIGFYVAGKTIWVGNEASTYVADFTWPDNGDYWHINYP